MKSYIFVLIFTLSASSQAIANSNISLEGSCCQIIKVESTGPLADFYPSHLGTFKILKDSTHVFKHLTNPHSFIYLTKSSNGSGLKWVIGADYTKKSFIATWSQRQWEVQEKNPKPSIFQWKRRRTPKQPVKDFCPLRSEADYQIWDGFGLISDQSMQLKCTLDKLDRMEIQGTVDNSKI